MSTTTPTAQGPEAVALLRAEGIARKAHHGARYGGHPYILHPLAVAKIVNSLGGSPRALQIALLHDVIEDTSWTMEDLISAGVGSDVVAGVMLLTHDEDQSYYGYLDDIVESEDDDALLVKYADLLHNTSTLKNLPTKQRSNLTEKYRPALVVIGAAFHRMRLREV